MAPSNHEKIHPSLEQMKIADLKQQMNSKTTASKKGPDGFDKLKVDQLKSLLKKKGLPVSGRKAELIERLRNGSNGGPKPKAWQHSDAKKDLKRALLNPKSPIHKMSIEEIRCSDPRYKRYPNFETYYKDLKKRVAAEKKQVQLDNIAVENHLKAFPRSHLNRREYPHWDNHAAKELLEVDVANKIHTKKTPQEFRDTRDAYKEFPKDVFAKRINNEVAKQRAAKFWAFKRNKRGMKKYLQDINDRAEGSS